MTQQPTQSIDLAGDGGNAFSFGEQGTQPGAFVSGFITALARVQQTDYKTKEPEFWSDGNPKMQYKVTLQTELRDPTVPGDTGVRDLYLDGSAKPRDNGTKGRLAAAVEAVKAVTGGTNLQVGGKLTVQWVSGMGYSGDPRNYQAWYEQPSVQLEQPAPPVQQPSVQQTVAQQAAAGHPAPQWAQAPGQPPVTNPAPVAPPVQQAPPPPQQTQQQAPPVQQQQIPTPTAPPPAGPPPQGPPPQIQQQAPAGAQHDPATLAALQAAGIDPATVPVQAH